MRMFLAAMLTVMLSLAPFGGGIPPAAASTIGLVTIVAPAVADLGPAFGLTLTLPANVAAFDGRLITAPGAAELVGLAPRGGGTALTPVESGGGYAFGVYDLPASSADATVDARTDGYART